MSPLCHRIEVTRIRVDLFNSYFVTGIAVRTDNSSYLMHHKFVIVDGRVLLSGSFNWTRQAISGNQENLLALSNRRIVRLYGREFEKLWRQFDPKNYTDSALHRAPDAGSGESALFNTQK